MTKLYLVAEVPWAERLFAEYEVAASAPMELSRIRALVGRGRLNEAQDALISFAAVGIDVKSVVDAYTCVADAEFHAGDLERAEHHYRAAMDFAHNRGMDELVVEPVDHLTGRLVTSERYGEAEQLVEEWLRVCPRSPGLWRRCAHVKWYSGKFSEAYSMLNQALDLGHERARILHARGQVLVEWETNLIDARRDLEEVLEDQLSETSEAYARSSLGFCLAKLGETEAALEQFDLSAKLRPDNAWLHYYQGRCYYEEMNDVGAARIFFERAMICVSPALNAYKRDHINEWFEREGRE